MEYLTEELEDQILLETEVLDSSGVYQLRNEINKVLIQVEQDLRLQEKYPNMGN